MFGRSTTRALLALAALLAAALFVVPGAMASVVDDDDDDGNRSTRAVYALTNSPNGNAVVVYRRAGDGSLTPDGSYTTGGNGTGAGLGSQGAVIVSDDGRSLFAATRAATRSRPSESAQAAWSWSIPSRREGSRRRASPTTTGFCTR